MRLFGRTTIALSALLLSSFSASGWGLDGHRATGAIADLILQNDPAGDAARDLLGASLSETATWMACVKGACHRPLSEDERGFVQSNPQQSTFHYTDVPIQQPRYKLGTAGTRNDDAVQVAKQAINVLRGRAPNGGPAVLDRKSALWVLVHLVGELHQPLHVGAIYYGGTCQRIVDPNVVGAGQPNFGIGSTITSTHRGNDFHLTDGKSFHVAHWDDGTVTGAMRLAGIQGTSIPDFSSFIVAHPPAGWETSGEPETWPEQWATEIMPLAKDALTRVQIGPVMYSANARGPACFWPVTLSRDYTTRANQQALAQIGKAGFRLAAVLRAVLPNQ
jgi:hypothetical protein